MWRFIFSILLNVVVLVVRCQENVDDSTAAMSPLNLSEVVLQANLLRPVEGLLNSEKNSYELRGYWLKNRWLFIAEVGWAATERGNPVFYRSEGEYWRLGTAYNLVKNPDLNNVVALGLNYARTGFNDEVTSSLRQDSLIVGSLEVPFEIGNSGAGAGWFEITGHLMTTIQERWVLGYTIRYQIFRRQDTNSRVEPFDLPGYGKTVRENSFSFDYYLGWKLFK